MESEHSKKRLEEYKKHIDEKFEPLFKIIRLIPEMRETIRATNLLLDNRHKIKIEDHQELYDELHRP